MAATGTHHVSAQDLFVPDDMAAASTNYEAGWIEQTRKYYADYDLFLGPPGAALALNVAVPLLGATQGAVESFRDHLRSYKKRSGSVEKENKTQQTRLAHAASLVTAAELLLRHATQEIFRMARSPDAQSDEAYHQSRAWLSEVSELCRNAMQVMVQAAGTTIHSYDSPFGRAYRDIMTGASHIIIDFDLCMSAYGQKMLGLEPPRRQTVSERQGIRDEIAATTRVFDRARAS